METFFNFIKFMFAIIVILLKFTFWDAPTLLSAGLCFPGLIIGFMLARYGERMCGSSASSTGHIDSFGNVSITHSPGVSGDANNIIEYLFALIVGFIGSILFVSSIIGCIIFFFSDHNTKNHTGNNAQDNPGTSYQQPQQVPQPQQITSNALTPDIIRAWQQDWGYGIVGIVTTRPCLSSPIWRNNIDEEIAKIYEFESYSMIPINRLKKPRNAWYTRNDGYAVTVIGCWSPTKHKIFFYRKSDSKKWTKNDFLIDDPNYPWNEIDLTSQETPK